MRTHRFDPSRATFLPMAEIDDALASLDLEARQLADDAAAGRPANPIQAERLVILARRLKGLLQIANRRGKLVSDTVEASTRADLGKQYSKAHGGSSGLTKAAHAAGHSLRSLAEECGVSHSYLSQLAKGSRPTSDAIRTKVEKLTGWSDWPRRKSG